MSHNLVGDKAKARSSVSLRFVFGAAGQCIKYVFAMNLNMQATGERSHDLRFSSNIQNLWYL